MKGEGGRFEECSLGTNPSPDVETSPCPSMSRASPGPCADLDVDDVTAEIPVVVMGGLIKI